MIRTVVLAFSLTGGILCSADPLRDRQEAPPATLDLHISAKATSLTLGQQTYHGNDHQQGQGSCHAGSPRRWFGVWLANALGRLFKHQDWQGKAQAPCDGSPVPWRPVRECQRLEKQRSLLSGSGKKPRPIWLDRFSSVHGARHLQRGFLLFQRPRTEVAGNPLGQA